MGAAGAEAGLTGLTGLTTEAKGAGLEASAEAVGATGTGKISVTVAGGDTTGSVTSCDTTSSAIKDLTSSNHAHWAGPGIQRKAPVMNNKRAAIQTTLDETMRPQGTLLMRTEPSDSSGWTDRSRG
jgi:hypothetical protein